MQVPSAAEYNTAITQARRFLKVQDDDLRSGAVEKISWQVASGQRYVQPWAAQGGFAIVYKFRRRSGALCALRCFHVAMPPDIQRRYEQIGPYLEKKLPQYSTTFRYHGDGIVVGIGNPASRTFKTYPLIEMEWVEGAALAAHVDRLVTEQDATALRRLAEEWSGVCEALYDAGIAHGDLAASNVIVRPDGRMVLIDYDGVFIPAFTGLRAVVGGQPDFQHPDFASRPFDANMDNFSTAAIYCALIAVANDLSLWRRYTQHENGRLLNENLLFVKEDYAAPQRSRLFAELLRSSSRDVRVAAEALRAMCGADVHSLPYPGQLFTAARQRQALEALSRAVRAGDDRMVLAAYDPVLDSFAPAAWLLNRVAAARMRREALARVKAALAAGDDRAIAAAYRPLLDEHPELTEDERARIARARRRVEALRILRVAIQTGDDERISRADHPELHEPGLLHAFEQQRLREAHAHVGQVAKLRLAFQQNDDEAITSAGQELRKRAGLTEREILRLEEAMRKRAVALQLQEAVESGSDTAIARAAAAAEPAGLALPVASRSRVELARQRVAALTRWRVAMMQGDLAAVVRAYDPVLDGCADVSEGERERLRLAREWSDDERAAGPVVVHGGEVARDEHS